MKIVDVEESICWFVETDEVFYSSYRRTMNGNWEVSIEDSWELVYDHSEGKELEILFQEYLKGMI